MNTELRYTPKDIIDRSYSFMPDASYQNDASALLEFYEDRATNRENQRLNLDATQTLFNLNIIKMVVDDLSVSYDVPPTRMLFVGNQSIKDNDPRNILFKKVYQDCLMDDWWRENDPYRNLEGTIFLRIYPHKNKKKLKLSRFLPTQLFRIPSSIDPKDISEDEAFVVCIATNSSKEKEQYEYWENLGFDEALNRNVWRGFIVNGNGDPIDFPFGEDGVCPYALPFLAIHSSATSDYAYEPLKTSRLNYQRNINEQLTNLSKIMTRQVSSQLVFTSDNPQNGAIQTGAKTAVALKSGETLTALDYRPQIEQAMAILENLSAMFFETEGLPSDRFSKNSIVQTGEAKRMEMLPLKIKQDSELYLVKDEQMRTFQLIREIWNYWAPFWGQPSFPEDIKVQVIPSPVPDLTSPKDRLEVSLKEIENGLSSHIQYIMKTKNSSREDAIIHLEQVQKDVLEYTKSPDGTEQGADIKLSLSGIQVTSAMSIVSQVASGQLPRSSGVEALASFFGMTIEQAELIFGDVGKGFVPSSPDQVQEQPVPISNEEQTTSFISA